MNRKWNKKKRPNLSKRGPLSLEEKVNQNGGKVGYSLEDSDEQNKKNDQAKSKKPSSKDLPRRTRIFKTPSSSKKKKNTFLTPLSLNDKRSEENNADVELTDNNHCDSDSKKTSKNQVANPYKKKFYGFNSIKQTPSSIRSPKTPSNGTELGTNHLVCSISENIAKETSVASIDAGSPSILTIVKQANGQTYAETLAYLEYLHPDEVILNEGRRNSQLAQKIQETFNADITVGKPIAGPRNQRRMTSKINENGKRCRDKGHADEISLYTTTSSQSNNNEEIPPTSTIVKFVPRTYFDQTRGAELLQKISRKDTYEASLVEEYIILSASYAVLQYTQFCLGATFSRNCLALNINIGGNNRMAIDRSTLTHLELLSNAQTGRKTNSLIATIDCTKTDVGGRLLRSNLMAPPTRVDTINARLDLVDIFLEDEIFFYDIMDNLETMPDLYKVLSYMALKPGRGKSKNGIKVTSRMASRGISALVCLKSVLSCIPQIAKVVGSQLKSLELSTDNKKEFDDAKSDEIDNSSVESNDTMTNGINSPTIGEDGTDPKNISQRISQDRSTEKDDMSLMIGLGTGSSSIPFKSRHQLLRAIYLSMKQPALNETLEAVLNIFTESTSYTSNSHAMRHQECFALKPNTDGMMDILRKAFLANVDDIYRLADEYAESYGITVAVKETTGRGYYLSIPLEFASSLPNICIQPVKSGRFIHCTTEEVN